MIFVFLCFFDKKIDDDSLASRQGEFRPGDQIIEMNYEPVVSRDQAIEIVRTSSRIHFRILRFEPSTKELAENDSGVIIHSPTTDLDTTLQRKYSFKVSEKRCSSSLYDFLFRSPIEISVHRYPVWTIRSNRFNFHCIFVIARHWMTYDLPLSIIHRPAFSTMPLSSNRCLFNRTMAFEWKISVVVIANSDWKNSIRC